MSRLFAALCLLASLHAQQGGGRGAAAQSPARIPAIDERTAGMQKIDGFFPVYWEERTGYLWLEIPHLDTPVLYATGLAAGLGSNDIGLDRGQEGSGKIVSFERRAERGGAGVCWCAPAENNSGCTPMTDMPSSWLPAC